MNALAAGLAVISLALAAIFPLLPAQALGGVGLALALAAALASALLAARRWTRPARVAVGILYLAQACLFVLAEPLGPRLQGNQAAAVLLVLMAGTALLLHREAERFNAWAGRAAAWLGRHPWAEGAGISALSVLVLLGGAEFLAAALARTGLLPSARPLTTTYRGRPIEDWRPFHITADARRVPDPYLFWRPAPAPPYNSLGFKGPEFAAAKPPGTFRILTLGDSNTDGPDAGGWPDELRRLLAARAAPGRRFEVINAGAVGYSSLQGLRRLEECLPYGPDLVVVSFGANDAHLVATGPDKAFVVRPGLALAALRALYRYRAFLLARYLATRAGRPAEAAGAALEPRVSEADYEANLGRMVALARGAGARAALLTRPYDPARARHAPSGNWIERAPSYNAATARVGARLGAPVLDAYTLFAAAGPETFADDSHFTLLGHARMAQALLDFLVREKLVP